MIRSNPNATAAGATSGLAAVITWTVGYFAGVDVPAPVAVAAAGAFSTVVLVIGREGIRGIFRRLWAGEDQDAQPLA